MRKLTKKMGFFMVFAAALTLVACGEKTTNDSDAKQATSVTQQTPKVLTPEELITQRVITRWAIRQAGKIDGLYDFLSPAQKQMYSKQSYENSFGSMVKYLDVSVKQVNCQTVKDEKEPAICEVKVYVDFETTGKVKTKAGNLITEKWMRQDNQWWISP